MYVCISLLTSLFLDKITLTSSESTLIERPVKTQFACSARQTLSVLIICRKLTILPACTRQISSKGLPVATFVPPERPVEMLELKTL